MDEREFDEFYAGSFQRIVGQVYAMIGNRDEAQDCVQEAFVRAWQHRRKLERAQSPEAWVRTAAHRLAISRWRRATRGRQFTSKLAGDTATEPASPEHIALVSALAQLPEGQRMALVLHHIADLPVRDVAHDLGVAEGTVKARLSRGRAALASLLHDTPLDEPGASHA